MPSANSRRKPASRRQQRFVTRAGGGVGASEHAIQEAWFDWWRAWAPTQGYSPILAFAVPNAGKRSFRAAVWLRAEGLQPGVYDVLLAIPARLWHGLFMEFKRPGEPLTADQANFGQAARMQGYGAILVRSTEEAILATTEYLGRREKGPRFLDFVPSRP